MMTLVRIGEPFPPPCTNPSHNPPNMIVLQPGTYQHRCPGCGNVMTFVVPHGPTLSNTAIT